MRTVAILNVGRSSVDELRRVLRHHADLVLRHQLLDRHAGERAVDMQTLAQNRRRDKLVLWHFLVQLVVGVLVEQNKVVRLLLHLPLRPLLLLRALGILRRGLRRRGRAVCGGFTLLRSHLVRKFSRVRVGVCT